MYEIWENGDNYWGYTTNEDDAKKYVDYLNKLSRLENRYSSFTYTIGHKIEDNLAILDLFNKCYIAVTAYINKQNEVLLTYESKEFPNRFYPETGILRKTKYPLRGYSNYPKNSDIVYFGVNPKELMNIPQDKWKEYLEGKTWEIFNLLNNKC